jgi:hypothetical protein
VLSPAVARWRIPMTVILFTKSGIEIGFLRKQLTSSTVGNISLNLLRYSSYAVIKRTLGLSIPILVPLYSCSLGIDHTYQLYSQIMLTMGRYRRLSAD